MAEVEIYTTTYCGYCQRAKALLRQKKIAFVEIDVTDDDEKREWLVQTTEQRTVPQIFINGQSIGGYDELVELSQSGKLNELLGPA